MTSAYIHGTSPEEQKRLSLLNDVLLNDAELREMNLRGGESIIDFGSGLGQFTRAMARASAPGRVIGIERDDDQRAAAKRLAKTDDEENLAEFRAGDVTSLDLPHEEWGAYDVAHARFVLEHVPRPLEVVKNMVRAVRPGGRIILADDDHEVLRLWPEPAGVGELWHAYMRTYDRNGNDPYIGRRLVALLHEAGAQPVRNTWIFFGACAGMEHFDVLSANMLGVIMTARDPIVGGGLLEETSFDEAVQAYRTWARRPDAALWFSMCWAEGRSRSHLARGT